MQQETYVAIVQKSQHSCLMLGNTFGEYLLKADTMQYILLEFIFLCVYIYVQKILSSAGFCFKICTKGKSKSSCLESLEAGNLLF